MKTITKIILTFLISSSTFQFAKSQNTAITDDAGYAPNSSAILDVKSTDKGMLVPRLTTSQRNLVITPAIGLLVFDTDENTFYFYNGTSWINLSSDNANGIFGYTSSNKVYLKDVNHNLGIGTTSPTNKLEVKADANNGIDQAIFNVVNNTGDTVFAVYPQGVRINVYDDPLVKAVSKKGGFAVGGFKPAKGTLTNEYLRVTPDSVRIYIEEDNAKASSNKGGFAVGGYKPSKATSTSDYFNIYGSDNAIAVPTMKARIYWYPKKEAFLAGKVIVESADSVGLNSFSTGYISRAKGNYSQSFGYMSIARGDYSTAIGKNAVANNINSFAIGDGSKAYANDAYAIGSGARAYGDGSYAIGSLGRDSLGVVSALDITIAQGDFSFAIGQGAKSIGKGAMTYGVNSIAIGDFSFAAGENAYSNSFGMVALGRNNYYSLLSNANVWTQTDPLFVVGDGHNNYRSNALTLLKNGKLGINVDEPSFDLEFDANSNKTIGMGKSTGNTIVGGRSLTIQAGSAKTLSSDQNGGELTLKSGNSTGAGASIITFYTASPGVVGSIEQNASEKVRITGNGNVGIGTINPTSVLTNNGSIALPIRTVATNTTLDANDYTILVNSNSTITLPSAIDCSGRIYIIKKVTAIPGSVTIDADGVQTIDGSLTKTLTSNNEKVVIQSNGVVWYIIN